MHVYYFLNITVLSKCVKGRIATVKVQYLPTHAENLKECAETWLEENIAAKSQKCF